MTLQEIFDQLTYGELSQLSIGGSEAGAIDEENYVRVIPHINLALTALYKRFPLKEGRLVLSPVINQLIYTITSKYAVQNIESTEPVKYLLDTVATPFKDDILKIERILTDAGLDVPLNDGLSEYSAFTPTSTTLRLATDVVNQASDLPDWLKTVNLKLIYRANHPKIVQNVGIFNPSNVVLQLPDTHLEPLLLFVAARMVTPLGIGQFEGLAGNNYMAKYEAACQHLEKLNLMVDQGSQQDRLHDKGWV